MPLKDLLKKKDKSAEQSAADSQPNTPTTPEFTFIRSDTHTQEIIVPPDLDDDYPPLPSDGTGERKRYLPFRTRHRAGSTSSNTSQTSSKSATKEERPESRHRRLSQRLGLKREISSSNVPENLPDIQTSADGEEVEGQWEERATRLAKSNEVNRSQSGTPDLQARRSLSGSRDGGSAISSKNTDDNIQEAIRLHEAGQLEEATRMFGRLADPNGENNALSQVLYGLSLRHGWGCTADPAKAVVYLSAAASNAASIEDMALQAGQRKGGAAKGELTLAIFELANSFRHGWGVEKDAVAAKQYYETAANLGDTDAMNEVAWCYLEGFGCKKDKFTAARYYRLAEKGGNKTIGNTWIWKPKYDPPESSPPSTSSSKKP